MRFSYVAQTTLERVLKALRRGKEGGFLKIVCKFTAKWVCQKPLFTKIHALDTWTCVDAVQPEFFLLMVPCVNHNLT